MSFRLYILRLILPLVLLLGGVNTLVLLGTERTEHAKHLNTLLRNRASVLRAFLEGHVLQDGPDAEGQALLTRAEAYWRRYNPDLVFALFDLQSRRALYQSQPAALPDPLPEAWALQLPGGAGELAFVQENGWLGKHTHAVGLLGPGSPGVILVIRGDNPTLAYADSAFWARAGTSFLIVMALMVLPALLFVAFLRKRLLRVQVMFDDFARTGGTGVAVVRSKVHEFNELAETVVHLGEAMDALREFDRRANLDAGCGIDERMLAGRSEAQLGLRADMQFGPVSVAVRVRGANHGRYFAAAMHVNGSLVGFGGRTLVARPPLELVRIKHAVGLLVSRLDWDDLEPGLRSLSRTLGLRAFVLWRVGIAGGRLDRISWDRRTGLHIDPLEQEAALRMDVFPARALSKIEVLSAETFEDKPVAELAHIYASGARVTEILFVLRRHAAAETPSLFGLL